ncbi:hypothetical protein M231_02885 [Tremella mesenterica]|uniref:Uncharacterized protein n=2 Tax=Tremella mesenterica TaxID=5217 RepID=A0A4Q1BPS0_TREME|nr:hypothetical protein M231_02885 [Tremella mesenterica]
MSFLNGHGPDVSSSCPAQESYPDSHPTTPLNALKMQDTDVVANATESPSVDLSNAPEKTVHQDHDYKCDSDSLETAPSQQLNGGDERVFSGPEHYVMFLLEENSQEVAAEINTQHLERNLVTEQIVQCSPVTPTPVDICTTPSPDSTGGTGMKRAMRSSCKLDQSPAASPLNQDAELGASEHPRQKTGESSSPGSQSSFLATSETCIGELGHTEKGDVSDAGHEVQRSPAPSLCLQEIQTDDNKVLTPTQSAEVGGSSVPSMLRYPTDLPAASQKSPFEIPEASFTIDDNVPTELVFRVPKHSSDSSTGRHPRSRSADPDLRVSRQRTMPSRGRPHSICVPKNWLDAPSSVGMGDSPSVEAAG